MTYNSLRDLYGEPEATLDDFIAVAMGEADFDTLRRRRELEKWALGKNLSAAQREMVLMVLDFKRANPHITPEQLLRSHLLEQAGGLPRIKHLFGSINNLIALADEAMSIETGTPMQEDNHGKNA